MSIPPASHSVSSCPPSPGAGRIACAFVGILDDEGRNAENAAYSPAGAQFQESLLEALASTSLNVTRVYSLRPVQSYPKCRTLLFGARETLCKTIPMSLLPFVNFGPLKTLTSGFALFPRLVAWAWRERHRPRVVLLYNLYSPPGIVSIVAGRLTRTPVVAIVADIQVPGQGLLPRTILRLLDFQLQIRTLPLFDGLVVLTKAVVEDFAPAVPFMELDGAVPESLMDPLQLIDREADGDSRCIIMYAGGLSELKGVPLLLSAFAMLDGEGFELWVTGRGPLEALVRQAADHDARITYWGFPAQEKLHELYARADVLVNPHSASTESARYLFPSKLIEYLATGVPVVSTCSTPAVQACYGDVAVVSGDGAPASLAEGLRRVASMSRLERRAIGRRGRSFVLREKSWRGQVDRVSAFVGALVEHRGTSTK